MKPSCMTAVGAAAGVLITVLAVSSVRSQTGGGYDLQWSAIAGGGGTVAVAPPYSVGGTVGQLGVGNLGGGGYALNGGFWAGAPPTGCRLDVDDSGTADVATDVVYLARWLLGLSPVPPSFRAINPGIPADAAIDAAIAAAGTAFDVDRNGVVDVATDVVYIARHLLGLTPVPPSFRGADPTIPVDSVITDAIDALCPSATGFTL